MAYEDGICVEWRWRMSGFALELVGERPGRRELADVGAAAFAAHMAYVHEGLRTAARELRVQPIAPGAAAGLTITHRVERFSADPTDRTAFAQMAVLDALTRLGLVRLEQIRAISHRFELAGSAGALTRRPGLLVSLEALPA